MHKGIFPSLAQMGLMPAKQVIILKQLVLCSPESLLFHLTQNAEPCTAVN